MEFSWDENKRLKTLDSRGLDFIGARLFFDGRPVVHQPTARHDEDRWKSTAAIEGGVLHGHLAVARRETAHYFDEEGTCARNQKIS